METSPVQSQHSTAEAARAEARIAVVGAGMMGADHVARLSQQINGAVVSAVIDADVSRAERAAAQAPGADVFDSFERALANAAIDGVLIATPGFVHENILLTALQERLPVLCEKPLTDAADSSARVVEAEQAAGKRLVQVGFIRRFDPEYERLRGIVAAGKFGPMLLMHARHRAPDVSALPNFTEQMLITDSIVHEMDILRFLTGEEIDAVTVIKPRASSRSAGLSDPQLVIIETQNGTVADVEINVNAQYGYEVSSEIVLESATFEHGRDFGLYRRHGGTAGRDVPSDFRDRFAEAYQRELSAWVASIDSGIPIGPSAWDGYAAQIACEAGLQAQRTPGTRVHVKVPPKPEFYA